MLDVSLLRLSLDVRHRCDERTCELCARHTEYECVRTGRILSHRIAIDGLSTPTHDGEAQVCTCRLPLLLHRPTLFHRRRVLQLL
jgi:hypothetical protein